MFDEIFAACGARLDDHVTVRKAEVLAWHWWDDASGHLDLFADHDAGVDAVGHFAGPEAARGYAAFAAEAARIFSVLEAPFLHGDKASTPLPMMWRMGLSKLPEMLAMRPFDGMWNALGEHFADPRLRQLFGRYATYCGSSPFKAPATLMLIAHLEAQGGVADRGRDPCARQGARHACDTAGRAGVHRLCRRWGARRERPGQRGQACFG